MNHEITNISCIHIEATHLSDGTYELVPTNENESEEVQLNSSEVIQDPNQSSEEPKANSAQEGKPRCIQIPIKFKSMHYML